MSASTDPSGPNRSGPVGTAIAACRRHFVAAAAFSAVANLLYLIPSIYMLQIYDRVVPTGGLLTLAAISVIAMVGLGVLSALDWLRMRLLIRTSAQLEATLAGPILTTVLARPGLSRLERGEAMRHFDALRAGLASGGVIALLDAPWTPIYILAAYLLHPMFGALALGSSLLLLLLAWSNERATSAPLRRAGDAASAAHMKQAHTAAYAAEVRALGMIGALTRRQLGERHEANRLQIAASFAGGTHGSVVKFLRLVLQSSALGVGAVLVVDGRISAGSMLAASLLVSRALAPVDQTIGSWKTLLQTRSAYRHLCALFGTPDRVHTHLPAPTGAVQVEGLSVHAANTDRVVLDSISFAVAPGEIIGVVGHSGAGKTSLLRALAGAVVPAAGHVRFDSASSQDWDSERLARHIGYLPQSFILFPGTIKENISRFAAITSTEDAERVDQAVIAAAQAIGAHEMILHMPAAYDTPIGSGGIGLSAGQTQRIAIARALYGNPRIVVLDEPTAHLDAVSQHALMKTLSQMRADGVTVFLATHSGDILASTDKLLLLAGGRIERFSPLADVVPKTAPRSHSPQKAMS